MPRTLLITAEPRAGKTTAINKIVAQLGPERCAGFVTDEVRESGERIGFDCATLSGQKIRFADISFENYPHLWRYGVNVRGFEQIILPAVLADLPHKEFIIIDEIGPMSFFSAQFKPFLDELFASGKPIIGTICLRPIPGVDEVKARPGVELIKLTPANRDQVPNEISQKLSTQ